MMEVKGVDFLNTKKLRRYGFAKVMDFESPDYIEACTLFLNNTKVYLYLSLVETEINDLPHSPLYRLEWYIIHGGGFHCKKIIIESEESLKQTVFELTGEKLQYGEFL